MRAAAWAFSAALVFSAGIAQADFGAVATAEGEQVSWGGAVAADEDAARAAALTACEERFEGVRCTRIETIPPDRCFAIAVELPMRAAVGFAEDVNIQMAGVKAGHACRRAGGTVCPVQFRDCVPPRVP